MVMFVWAQIRSVNTRFARHPEMNAEPIVPREFEEHAFPARARTQKFFAD